MIAGRVAIAATVVIAATAVIVGVTATMTAGRVMAAMKPKRRRNNNGSPTWWRPSAVLPSTQDMPVLRRQRAEDRLQGRQAAAALHFGARQDRAEPQDRKSVV